MEVGNLRLTRGNRMKKPKIIATVNSNVLDEVEWRIRNMMEYGITDFRVNLSKMITSDEIDRQVDNIVGFKTKYCDTANIMLDLPYPQRKLRIFLQNGANKMVVNKGDCICLCSQNTACIYTEKLIFADDARIYQKRYVGERVVYGDLEGEFTVVDICDDKRIILEAKVDVTLKNTKSLVFETQIDTVLDIQMYVNCIKRVKPESITLSFVEDVAAIRLLKEELHKEGIDTQIISKIESKRGMSILDSILQETEVMLGRGDYCNIDPLSDLISVEKTLINCAERNCREVYIATGIMNSLINASYPSQSDLVDLWLMLKLGVSGIVLNGGLTMSDYFSNACEIIMDIISKNHLE